MLKDIRTLAEGERFSHNRERYLFDRIAPNPGGKYPGIQIRAWHADQPSMQAMVNFPEGSDLNVEIDGVVITDTFVKPELGDAIPGAGYWAVKDGE